MVAAERLWWLNNAYHTHLKQAEHYLGLLEMLLIDRSTPPGISCPFPHLHELRQHILNLSEDLRHWRYTDYYQPIPNKRMVASESDIHRAIFNFRRLRNRHHRSLETVLAQFAAQPPPDPTLTSVELGDLWDCAVYAIQQLYTFVETADGP